MLELITTPKDDLEIKNQVLKDLEYFAKEKNISTRELMKEISEAQYISLEVLEKILEKSSVRPSNETLIKIYSFLYSTFFLTDIFIKTPEIISNSIKLDFLNIQASLNKKIVLANNSELTALSSDNLFNILYLMTSGDFGTSLTIVKEKMGKNGLQMLDKMIQLRIVRIDENEKITRENAIFLSPEIRKNMLVTLAKDIYKPAKNDNIGSNYSGYFVGDVTPEDYDLIYSDIKKFFDSIGNRIFNSKPTAGNYKKIALGGILEEIEKNKDGEFLC